MEKFPAPPSPENIEAEIEKLLEKLESFAELYDEIGSELQDAWYDAEMEAKVGKDRATAKKHLEEFLNILERQKTNKE